ncbi:MAG TPA: glycosyltransferase [Vicinamibacterales bacterium]|nr:glycosyltransferase [Vicinamibacterales bacterium]
MKVVHAAKFYAPVPGGIETIVADLCDGTAGEWDVTVVAANDRPQTVVERRGAVTVVRAAAFGRPASVPLCPSLPFHLWTRRADCIVLHEPNPIAGTALWLRTPARRLVVWHHSDLLRPWWALPTYARVVQRMLYRRADCVVVSNPVLAARSPFVKHARRVAVIPFGIDLRRFNRDRPLHPRVAALVARVRRPIALFVGRLVYYKGLHVLLEAARRWPGSIVVGGDGPLEMDLKARADALGLADRVHWAGRVSDEELPSFYAAADVFVLPSIAKTETFGVSQIEAMAAGVPVVSTNLPTGVPWVNQDDVSGIVVEPNDAAALGAALERLAGDPALHARLAEGARRRASDRFSRDRMVRAFHDLVDTVVRAPEELDARLAAEAL